MVVGKRGEGEEEACSLVFFDGMWYLTIVSFWGKVEV